MSTAMHQEQRLVAFVSDKNEGFVLLLVMVLSGALGIFMYWQMARINKLTVVVKTTELARDRDEWANYVKERLDCERVLTGYSATNKCPDGTARDFVFFNKAPEPKTGPNQSTPLGKDWYGKIRCGVNDLKLLITSSKNDVYIKHPLTGRSLGFADSWSQVSDMDGGVALCPSYFNAGTPPARTITMSIASHQEVGTVKTVHGEVLNLPVTCNSTIGHTYLLDYPPLDARWRDGGTAGAFPNKKSATGELAYNVLRPFFDSFGGTYKTSKLQSNWPQSPFYASWHGDMLCDTMCIRDQGANAGKMVKCDPSVSATWPGAGVVVRDSIAGQVVCLCWR